MERGRVFFMLILLVFVAGCTRNKNPAVDLTDENSPGWPSWLEVGTPVKIVDQGHSPDWSPDGKKIAYIAWINGGDNIFVTSDTGGVSTQITHEDSALMWTPSWSPDGTAITFTAGRVFAVIATGGTPQQLTPDSLSVQGCDWSPDGTCIVFDSGIEHVGNVNLWTIRLSDNKITHLTFNVYDGWPEYSPDGLKIAVEGIDNNGNYQIFTMNSDGSNRKQITQNEGMYPCWSPDGKWIAFVTYYQSGNCDIWIVPSTGGKEIQITSSPENENRPAWSPDGKKIAYDTATYPSDPAIWVVPVIISE